MWALYYDHAYTAAECVCEIDAIARKMDETEADISNCCINKHEGLNQYHDQNCRYTPSMRIVLGILCSQ